MKQLFAILLFLLSGFENFAQGIPFGYSVQLKQKSIPGLPGLHSFAVAQWQGKWLLVGGRRDGLHARQPNSSFPAASNNTDLLVVDVAQQQFWSVSVNALPVGIREQLQSTNMNFYQDHDTLVLIGGYGYSNTQQDHITFPNLTTIHVSGLIQAIINAALITSFIKQINDPYFAVNGGQLGKIGNYFYLVGGHRFDGRYNPMGNPTYVQTYVSGIKKFQLNNAGVNPAYFNSSFISDQVHLHRRDYNLVPQLYSNGVEGYMLSSGVFQPAVNLPYLYPVDITAGGYTPQVTFNQYLSNYHSAKVAIFDSVNLSMHALFFGGMSQYSYVNNALVQDNTVPFVKTISRVSRDVNAQLEEHVMDTEMPDFLGASAEFMINMNLPHTASEIIILQSNQPDSILLGHMYGGIYSPTSSPFTNNTTHLTSASSSIVEVWLKKQISTKVKKIDGKNPVNILVYPNPANKVLSLRYSVPYPGKLTVFVSNSNGHILHRSDVVLKEITNTALEILNPIDLPPGLYIVNTVFDGKFASSSKVLIH